MSEPIARTCPFCSYELTGLRETIECPECGNTLESADKRLQSRVLTGFARGLYCVNMSTSLLGMYLSYKATRTSMDHFDGFLMFAAFYLLSVLFALFGVIKLSKYVDSIDAEQNKVFNALGTLATMQFFLLIASCPVLVSFAD